jgi:hypothetical protein
MTIPAASGAFASAQALGSETPTAACLLGG